ncbi:hypothetical protein EON65_57245, partial [archaeon]
MQTLDSKNLDLLTVSCCGSTSIKYSNMQRATNKKSGTGKRKGKALFHVYDEGVKGKEKKDFEEGPFSIDDIVDIENTIVSLQQNDHNYSEYGWTSPLRSNTPLKIRSATKSSASRPLLNRENTLSRNPPSVPASSKAIKTHHAALIALEDLEEDDIDRKWEKIRRQMFPDLPPLPPTPAPTN